MASPERKRYSNIAPVRRLRSLAWMKARRLPGVRCSTLNTPCRSLLCLITMPGRSWVAGIAMLVLSPSKSVYWKAENRRREHRLVGRTSALARQTFDSTLALQMLEMRRYSTGLFAGADNARRQPPFLMNEFNPWMNWGSDESARNHDRRGGDRRAGHDAGGDRHHHEGRGYRGGAGAG